MAKEIADSALVKTAIAGGDPNWGRIVSAAGYAHVDFDTAFVSLHINGTEVYRAGIPVPFDAAALSKQLKTNRDVHLVLAISGGSLFRQRIRPLLDVRPDAGIRAVEF